MVIYRRFSRRTVTGLEGRGITGIYRWFRFRFIPWTSGRMFRTGVPLDQPVIATGRVITTANAITLIRLLSLPGFVYLSAVRHAWLISFVFLGVLVVLDTADGYVARRFNQATRLGAALDPFVDRLTIATIGITLALVGVIPAWIVVLILLRDVLLLALVATFARLGRPLPVKSIPVTRAGKLATMILLFSLPFLLLIHAGLPGSMVIHIAALVLTCAGIVIYYVALAQYAMVGITGRPPAPVDMG